MMPWLPLGFAQPLVLLGLLALRDFRQLLLDLPAALGHPLGALGNAYLLQLQRMLALTAAGDLLTQLRQFGLVTGEPFFQR